MTRSLGAKKAMPSASASSRRSSRATCTSLAGRPAGAASASPANTNGISPSGTPERISRPGAAAVRSAALACRDCWPGLLKASIQSMKSPKAGDQFPEARRRAAELGVEDQLLQIGIWQRQQLLEALERRGRHAGQRARGEAAQEPVHFLAAAVRGPIGGAAAASFEVFVHWAPSSARITAVRRLTPPLRAATFKALSALSYNAALLGAPACRSAPRGRPSRRGARTVLSMRPVELIPLFAAARTLTGVGPRIELLLKKALRLPPGSSEPRAIDLLWHTPTGVIDRRATPTVAAAVPGTIATLELRVLKYKPGPRGNPRAPYKVTCEDETGRLDLVFFHAERKFIERQLPPGSVRYVSGRIESYNDG